MIYRHTEGNLFPLNLNIFVTTEQLNRGENYTLQPDQIFSIRVLRINFSLLLYWQVNKIHAENPEIGKSSCHMVHGHEQILHMCW